MSEAGAVRREGPEGAALDPAAHPIVLFDGVCHLCHGTVRFVIERDPAARFRFAALQSEVGRALLRRQGLDPEALDGVVLVDGAGAHQKSDAMLRIARGLRWPWRGLAVLLWLPAGLRDRAYDFVATRRYRWFGRSEACLVPDPDVRGRFLA